MHLEKYLGLIILMATTATAQTVSYTPLSDEAARFGHLPKPGSLNVSVQHLELEGLILEATVPQSCEAYNLVPIQYRLSGTMASELVAVEATAFEEPEKRKGQPIYDLALPGRMQIKVEYLGSQTGLFDSDRVVRLKPGSKTGTFPPYTLLPFTRSTMIQRGNNLWFKFRITNTGDTILDPEGFGAWMTRILVYGIDKDGKRTLVGRPINDVFRHLEYVYPGESFEQWADVWSAGQPMERCRTLPPGKYVVVFEFLYRWYRDYNWIINMWQGKPSMGLEVPIEIVEKIPESAATEIKSTTVHYEPVDADRMTRYFERFEEFMTSFDIHRKDAVTQGVQKTLFLQVAPWTREIVLKLMTNKPGEIKTVAIPIKVNRDRMEIHYNPANPFAFIRPDGKREAWIFTQAMPAMRTTSQLGPHPEIHLRERLKEMHDLGINVICTTAGDWHLSEIYNPQAFVGDIHAETFKYYYDVITREIKMPVFGWGIFPPKTGNALSIGNLYWKSDIQIPKAQVMTTYSSRPEMDVGHPDFPKLYAGGILFNYDRWGDQWVKTADGDVLVDVEDTWGWLRDDINLRYYMGEQCIRRFREWVKKKYTTLDAANRAWGTQFSNFDEIDPQKDQRDGGTAYGFSLAHVSPEYTNPDNPFHDWSPAVEDWDRFRTELRCDIYDEIQRIIREKIPNARINLRTEGACILADVPENATTPHLRHVRYALRRNALMPDILKERKTFRYHSDYTTLPYTEDELRQLLRSMTEAGIRGNYLPQFDGMRDMFLNDDYGREWQIHYNIPQPKHALMVHCLTAAYPWFRVTYEEGHCPGVLWEDYACDGFVTVTQKKEIRLFRDALNRAMKAN